MLISNHTIFDGSKTKIPALERRKPGDPNLRTSSDADSVQRYLTVGRRMREAGPARAQ